MLLRLKFYNFIPKLTGKQILCLLIILLLRNVLVKGGDLPDSSDAVDILFNGKIKCIFLKLMLSITLALMYLKDFDS